MAANSLLRLDPRTMPEPDETRDETIRRLDARAEALRARTATTPQDHGVQAAGYGYRLLGILLGGLFVGIAIGAGADALLRSAPWGMICGVLVGFVVSVWMAVRSAQRMSEETAREWGPPKDLPPDDEED
ncbi:F0F1 ATP synthase assembly protein I [Phenylobacterium sp.]|jgi:ATP synthase protein I|uniref:AtpZ/AtpI family protein n=1 Tax=Phenylobacterium sp. TaxID=1871053 RepID=UPI002E318382|nr:F0F1 ATP synthase assembly protein I [Phenylobacterium sp.]HEX2558930.1 F0F1 ATP synthase assembly protein I [Phenylobacterium sp.]